MLTITEAAKTLSLGRRELVAWLIGHRWCYRLGLSKSLAGCQRVLARGDLSQKVVLVTGADGTQRARAQVLITAKGLARLSVAIHGRTLEGSENVSIRP